MEQSPNTAAQTNDPTLNRISANAPAPATVSAAPDDALPPAGTPPCDLVELSPAQCTALEALAAGRSITEAVREAGISRSTLYRWRKTDPGFIVALNAWRTEVLSTARDRVLSLADEATRTLYRVLRKDHAGAALTILKSIGVLAPPRIGATDLEEAALSLKAEEEERVGSFKARQRAEAEAIRKRAREMLFPASNTREFQDAVARGVHSAVPHWVRAELRRADQLLAQACNLPYAPEPVEKPPANNPQTRGSSGA